MRPEEYNMMVEKLAEEIVEDVLDKEAAANSDRATSFENFYSTNKSARKLINAELDRDDLHRERMNIKDKINDAKKDGDKEEVSRQKMKYRHNKTERLKNWGTRHNPITHVVRNAQTLPVAPGTMAGRIMVGGKGFLTAGGLPKTTFATPGARDQQYGYERAKDAIRAERQQKTAEEMIMEYAFEKEAAFHPIDALKNAHANAKAKSRERAAEKMVNDPNSPLYSASTKKSKATYSTPVDYKDTMKDHAAAAGRFVKNHPYGTAAAVAGTAAVAGGLAAYKHHKKKKEQAQDKVAAYWEDAQLWKEAASNVWEYAETCEDEYEAELLKNAAEEVYDEAEAQAEAAENVFDAIENGEIEDFDGTDADYAEDGDYEDYE